MNTSLPARACAACALLCITVVIVRAEPAASAVPAPGPSMERPTAAASAPALPASAAASEPEASNPQGYAGRHHPFDRHARDEWRIRDALRGRDGNDLVSIAHDSHLAAGQQADAVVSVLGSSSSEGDVVHVVSIVGNTHVSGVVRDSAVAVAGNVTIDGRVEGDAVAVLGNVELGPHAEVDGDVVAVLGSIHRDPEAIVHGGSKSLFGGIFGDAAWLQAWVNHCLLYGRPLAFAPGLGWAWGLAFGFLALYACLAALFRSGIDRCVQTVETQPARTLLAAFIAMLLTPVLITLLCVTIVGIAAVPFVVAALFCAGLFGHAVMLTWIGRRLTGNRSAGPLSHPAPAVLIGGMVVMVLYVVPVLGFLVYKLLGILGFGAVAYTLMLNLQAHQHAKNTRAPPSAPPSGGPAAAPDAQPAQPIPPPVAAALPRAGFWVRMAALFLDVLLVGFAMSVLHHPSHLHMLVLAAYGAVMWKMRGSTVGGIVFDLKVVRLDGRDIDWETAIVRALACFLSLAVAGLGFLWIAFDDANQAWHDKIAGTVVVRVPKGAPLV